MLKFKSKYINFRKTRNCRFSSHFYFHCVRFRIDDLLDDYLPADINRIQASFSTFRTLKFELWNDNWLKCDIYWKNKSVNWKSVITARFFNFVSQFSWNQPVSKMSCVHSLFLSKHNHILFTFFFVSFWNFDLTFDLTADESNQKKTKS